MDVNEAEAKPTNLQVTARTGNAIVDASESRVADAAGGRTVAAEGSDKVIDRKVAYKNEVAAFCSAVRSGTPLRCGPEKAVGSASACIRAFESHEQKSRLTLA